MNERILELAKQADLIQWDTLPSGARTPDHESVVKAKKFAELIVRECEELNLRQSYELSGVLIDIEEGSGFDEVCLNTVKRVHRYLNGKTLYKHFGVEE